MEPLRIAAVSYLNTKPFIYGINNCLNLQDFELNIYPPAECAQQLIIGEAEIGLVPVAALPLLKDYKIISDYCIGSERKVESVCLYSNSPLNEIKKIVLDFESRTSVQLVKILAANYWNITPEWIKAEKGFEKKLANHEGAVVIGDKTFDLKDRYAYTIDLATEWFNYSGLPFVFACWVCKNDIDKEKIDLFNNALTFGINHIEYALKEYEDTFGKVVDLQNYFKNCISFELTPSKKEGLQLFLKLLTENQQLVSNLLHVN